MKKAFLSLFLIALAAVLSIGCVAEPPIPPMESPELLYGDTYFENGSDGSEVIMLYLLDAANDEQNEVTDETALVITEHMRIGDKEFMVLNNVWQNSEFGKVFICSFDNDGSAIWRGSRFPRSTCIRTAPRAGARQGIPRAGSPRATR